MFVPRTLFHFEAPEDGGGGLAVADSPAGEAGADPLPDAAPGADAGDPTPPSGEAAAPAWQDSPDFQRAVSDAAAEQLHRLMQEQGVFGDDEPAAGDEPLSLDPLSDDFGQNLLDMLDQRLEARLAPLQRQEEQKNLEEGQQRVNDIIADFTSREGEFLTESKQPGLAASTVKQMSSVFYAEEAARFGEGPRAAESAIQRAAQLVRQIEQAAGEAYHDKQVNHLASLAGQGDLQGGASAGTEVRPQYANELEAARAFAARTRAV